MPLEFIDPGMLRTPLELQTCNDVSDGQGGVTRQWTSVASLFARVVPVSAANQEFGRSEQSLISHHITIRYREDIATEQRFLRNDRILIIRNVHDVDETKRYQACQCEEVAP